MMASGKGFWACLGTLPGSYWCVVVMRVLERVAHYSVRAWAVLYLVNNVSLDTKDVIWILSIWGMFATFVPLVSGCFTDRYGYRKTLGVACVAGIAGYLGMAQTGWISERAGETPALWVFLVSTCIVGGGSGILKPAVYGTVAKISTRETASQGWGLLFLLVNVGAFIAPLCSDWLRVQLDYTPVFYIAAGLTALNLFLAIRWFREPEREGPPSPLGPLAVLLHSAKAIAKDLRFLIFLLILSCFLLVSDRLFGNWLPDFVANWVDAPASKGGFLSEFPQVWPSLASLFALILLPVVAWVIWKRNMTQVLAFGMLIAVAGSVVAGSTGIGALCALGFFVLTVGELSLDIGIPAYIGFAAPNDRKATYMGCYMALPGIAVSVLAMAVALALPPTEPAPARTYIAEYLGVSEAFATDDVKLPDEQVLRMMAHLLKHNDGRSVEEAVEARWLEVDDEDLYDYDRRKKAAEVLEGVLGGVDDAALQEARQVLRKAYRPFRFAFYYGALGLLVVVAMFVFHSRTRRSTNPQEGS